MLLDRPRRVTLPFACALSFALAACGAETTPGPALPGDPIPKDPQREGDPQAGYAALVGEGYVSCGVPFTAFSQVFGAAPAEYRLPGRNDKNKTLPYFYTRFTTTSGVDVVSANCLSCHASFLNGELVVGLGDTQNDFTSNNQGFTADLAQAFLTDPAEKEELSKFAGRLKAIGSYTETLVVGVNPADNLAAVLFAHRDRKTLEWFDEPLMDLPPTYVVPVDVPPWWRMKKKNAMFYVAGGRGDHARIEMTASTLCTDSVEEAQKIDAYFPDVAAFIASIEPPKFPYPIDAARADQGKKVFESTCSSCHGTYGEGGEYPNLLVPLATIGTDSLMVTGSTQFADIYVDWFNESFYGEIAHLAPQQGYVAPPLDGIWATAPFLHNGSVPTLEALLDSSKRPMYWSRKYDQNGVFDASDYDDVAVGWRFTTFDHGHAEEKDPTVRKHLYDTTEAGYSNEGHTFGDGLSAEDRAALMEYLKTL